MRGLSYHGDDMKDDDIILPFKGKTEMDCGVVYAPYVPLQVSSAARWLVDIQTGLYQFNDYEIIEWIESQPSDMWAKFKVPIITPGPSVFRTRFTRYEYKLSSELEAWFKLRW